MSWMMRQSCRASPGRINSLVYLDHATFDLRDDTFVLFLQRPGKHYVCVMCRLAEEEIYGNVKLELFQSAPGVQNCCQAVKP